MNRPIPILLMVRSLGAGGTERQLTEIARALDRSQFDPHVACFHMDGCRVEELKSAGVPILRVPVRSFHSPSAVAGAGQLNRYFDRRGIQIVHTFDVPMDLFGVPVARAFRVPIVISSQRASRDLTSGLRRHLLRLTDQMVDAIVVNCRAMRRHLMEEEGVDAGLIHLCYNGIDTEVFRPLPATHAGLVIGIVASLRPEKSLHTLLEAFSKVRHLRPGLKVVIVGSGSELASLKAWSEALGIAGDCHFEPETRSVADWLRTIDIFVLPSLTEALSNSLMEAMACGCCAVATGVGGNPELIVHGESGFLFRPGDASGLAGCLAVLIQDEPLRRGMAAAGARYIAANFSLQASARRMGEIYCELLDRLQ